MNMTGELKSSRSKTGGVKRPSSAVYGEREKVSKETACCLPPGVNNPSQIDLTTGCSGPLRINLKLISPPEVEKTSSRPYQKYCGVGQI
ncbi:RNA-binding Raly-like protein isoform X1 [Tachysurus ichikawai]